MKNRGVKWREKVENLQSIYLQKKSSERVGRWMERWVGGGKSCFKDCLQQSKICRKIEMQKKKEQLEFEQIDRKYGKINTEKQKIKPENISAPELLPSNLFQTSHYQ